MSHFTVAVITKGEPSSEDIERLLAPYDENKEVVHYITKEELIARRRKSIEEYAASTYAEYLSDKEGYIKKYGDRTAHIAYITEKFPKELKWTDEECYQAEIAGYEPEDIMPDGSLRSTYNPDSQWDWWQIGGRWADLLFINESCEGIRGEKSWGWGERDPYKCDIPNLQKVDSARIKDLVFPNTEKERKNAERFWELYVEKQEPLTDDDREMISFVWESPEHYLETYKTKENYARICSIFTTYAAITKDGVWHQQGKMGWWGISTGDDRIGWAEGYKALIFDGADDDDWITIVDCHI